MSDYIPNTKKAQEEMLESIGMRDFDELFSMIPDSVKLKQLDLPEGLSEFEVQRKLLAIANENYVYPTVFRGAGAYRHYIPALVKSILSKEEFLTAYTPYQAEISQGVLQSIFEYQTMICELTGMDVSNASVYDGASAAAEAAGMCCERKRQKVYISQTCDPNIIETVKTYCWGKNREVILIPEKEGLCDIEALSGLLDEESACVLIQQPNYYGLLEDCTKISEITHAAKAKMIMSCNPISLAILPTPKEVGADIAVGEGQPLGMSMAFGGPYLGFMSTVNAMARKLPGRIVGETVDADGKRAYVLTLQAREQHIRREKASSNICSNQAYCALNAAVYMAVMGEEGLKQVAHLCTSKAHYLRKVLIEAGMVGKYDREFFHEFVLSSSVSSAKINAALKEKGILGGYPLSETETLWCATEMNTKEEMDECARIIKEVLSCA